MLLMHWADNKEVPIEVWKSSLSGVRFRICGLRIQTRFSLAEVYGLLSAAVATVIMIQLLSALLLELQLQCDVKAAFSGVCQLCDRRLRLATHDYVQLETWKRDS